MRKVVLFSINPHHINFADYVAKTLKANLVFENNIENLEKEDINLIPDYLSHSDNVSKDCIILDTNSSVKPKFSTLVSNLETSSSNDYRNFLLHLGLLEFNSSKAIILNKSEDKYTTLNFFRDLLKSSGVNSQIVGDIVQVLDETLMNAIFDAAKLNIPRNSKFKLDRPVVMEWALENNLFYFKVVDLWGSLDKDKVIKHINQNLDEYEIDPNYHGAGLGLHRSFFGIGANMKFECIENKRTAVSCLFNLKRKSKDFKKQLKFFSIN